MTNGEDTAANCLKKNQQQQQQNKKINTGDEATTTLQTISAAKEVGVDAAIPVLFSEPGAIFTLKRITKDSTEGFS